MSSINLRCAKLIDANNVYLIDQEYEHERYSLDMVKTSIEDDKYYNVILSVDGIDVGYLSATMVSDECELIKIVVRKSFRGKGYGKILMNDLFRECRKRCVKKIFLEVRENNSMAKSLYENCGLKRTHTRKGYYEGIDADIYWCEIDDKND